MLIRFSWGKVEFVKKNTTNVCIRDSRLPCQLRKTNRLIYFRYIPAYVLSLIFSSITGREYSHSK